MGMPWRTSLLGFKLELICTLLISFIQKLIVAIPIRLSHFFNSLKSVSMPQKLANHIETKFWVEIWASSSFSMDSSSWSKLPRELMELIFRRSMNTKDLGRCSLVCTTWRLLIGKSFLAIMYISGTELMVNYTVM